MVNIIVLPSFGLWSSKGCMYMFSCFYLLFRLLYAVRNLGWENMICSYHVSLRLWVMQSFFDFAKDLHIPYGFFSIIWFSFLVSFFHFAKDHYSFLDLAKDPCTLCYFDFSEDLCTSNSLSLSDTRKLTLVALFLKRKGLYQAKARFLLVLTFSTWRISFESSQGV